MTVSAHNLVRNVRALRLLKTLSPGEAGAVFLDPPAFGPIDEGQTVIDERVAYLTPVAEQVGRVLRPGGACVFMGGPQATSAWEVVASSAGLQLMAEIIVLWDMPQNGAGLTSLTTAIRWHVQPGKRYTKNAKLTKVASNVLVCGSVPYAERVHPMQRPVELYNYLVSLLTEKRDLVVDPFCGSGSALVAAALCGRRWLGGDADLGLCGVASERVRHKAVEEQHLGPIYLWTRRRLTPVEG